MPRALIPFLLFLASINVGFPIAPLFAQKTDSSAPLYQYTPAESELVGMQRSFESEMDKIFEEAEKINNEKEQGAFISGKV